MIEEHAHPRLVEIATKIDGIETELSLISAIHGPDSDQYNLLFNSLRKLMERYWRECMKIKKHLKKIGDKI